MTISTIDSQNKLEDRVVHLKKIMGMSTKNSQAYHLAEREYRGIVRTVRDIYDHWKDCESSLAFHFYVCHLPEDIKLEMRE